MEATREKIMVEQLFNIMPTDLCIWVSVRKLETGSAVGELADNNLQVRRKEPEVTEEVSRVKEHRVCRWKQGGVCIMNRKEILPQNVPRRRNRRSYN